MFQDYSVQVTVEHEVAISDDNTGVATIHFAVVIHTENATLAVNIAINILAVNYGVNKKLFKPIKLEVSPC